MFDVLHPLGSWFGEENVLDRAAERCCDSEREGQGWIETLLFDRDDRLAADA